MVNIKNSVKLVELQDIINFNELKENIKNILKIKKEKEKDNLLNNIIKKEIN